MKGLAYVPILAGICLTFAIVGWGDYGILTQSLYQEIEVKDGGAIHGIVRLSGDASEIEDFEITKNADYCGNEKPSPHRVVGESIAQPVQGQRVLIRAKRFRFPGLVLTTCDAGHAWMSGYIVVAEHPYYTLTDANGAFILDKVPPGSYRLRMWHEGISVIETEVEHGKPKKYHFEQPYEITKEVIVLPNGEVRVEFELALR